MNASAARRDDRVVAVDESVLKPVLGTETTRAYIGSLWRSKSFIWQYAKARSFHSVRGTLLGYGWLILGPFLNALILYLIFGPLLQIDRGIPNYLGFVVVGVNFFVLLRQPLLTGGKILPQARSFAGAFAFPRASLVLSWVLRLFIDSSPALIFTLAFIWALPPHAEPAPLWLLLVPLMLVVFIFSLGLALLTAGLSALLPDLTMLWPAVGRIWFYGSGVFYGLGQFAHSARITALIEANPGYIYLQMVRDLLLYNTFPAASNWTSLFGWAAGTLALGGLSFWLAVEKRARN